MSKVVYSLFVILILSNLAWAGPDVRLSAKQIKRVVALENSISNNELEASQSQNKYAVEIERMAQIRAGAYGSVESVSGSFGLLYRKGYTVKARTQIEGLHELSDFEDQSLKATLHFGEISYIAEGEEYSYEVEGTTIISPNIKMVGLWITIGGTWSLTIKREGQHRFTLRVSLLKLKDGSLCVSKGWAYGGFGISSSLEQGMVFEVRDDDANVQKVVDQFLGGDIRPLQSLAQKNKNYKLIEKSEAKSKGSYSYFGMMSPYVSWFTLGLSSGVTETESQKMDAADKIINHEKSVTYVAENRLQLLNYLSSSSRTYKIADDLTHAENDEVKLQSSEIWESEWSIASTSQLAIYLKHIQDSTLLAKDFQIKMPNGQSAGYAKIQLEINYDPDNFSYIQRHNNLVDKMRNEAYAQLVSDYQNKFEVASHSASAPTIYNILTNERFQHISNLNFAWAQMKKYLKGELTLEGRALMMRSIFRSPYMYKQWFEFSKTCGLSYKLSLATTKFDFLVKEQRFEAQGVCR